MSASAAIASLRVAVTFSPLIALSVQAVHTPTPTALRYCPASLGKVSVDSVHERPPPSRLTGHKSVPACHPHTTTTASMRPPLGTSNVSDCVVAVAAAPPAAESTERILGKPTSSVTAAAGPSGGAEASIAAASAAAALPSTC